jgi:ABC-2 type transport system permease protein
MKLARDTWLTFQYEAGLLLRNPFSLLITLVQPLTYLVFLTPFLLHADAASSYGAAYEIYVPSLYGAMGVFSGMFAGFALLGAMRQGVIERFRVTPLSRVGLLLGRELMYVLLIGFQAVVVTIAAVILGLRVGFGDFLLALVLLAMMVLVSVSLSYALALWKPDETTLNYVINSVTQPVSLLAGVLLPLSIAPVWERDISLWNPFAWGTRSMRAVFAGHIIGNQVVWEAVIILVALAAGAVLVSSRLFRREIA